MPEFRTPKRITTAILAVIIFIIVLVINPFVTIDSSERGVVKQFGAVKETLLTDGFHVITPFIDKVVKVSIKPTALGIDVPVNSQGAITKDNQTVGAQLTVFYKFAEKDLINIAKNYGFDVLKEKINKDVIESFKQAIGTYTIFDVASKQEEIRKLVLSGVIAKISNYPISIDDIKISNYDWSDEFDAQIAKTMQIAQESKQQEQELNKVKFSAQQQVIQAQANFDAEKLNADAQKVKGQGIADYNAAITANPKNMELELKRLALENEKARIAKWDGHYVATNNYGPIPVSYNTPMKGE